MPSGKDSSSTSQGSKPYRTAFAEALKEQLAAKELRQSDLARLTDVSRSYISHTIAGRKSISPEWADVIASAIDASEEERRRLHRAAALDAGFKIEPEPKRGSRRKR
jgi:plasmid maintenance system antidote protein VapI